MSAKYNSVSQQYGLTDQSMTLITPDLELAKDLMAALALSDRQAQHPEFQVPDQKGLCCLATDYRCCDSGPCFDYDFYRFCYCLGQTWSCSGVPKDN